MTHPREKRKLAFVLSGGGSRGALQAGALRALLEANFIPQLLTGTSIGACNAAFIALNGFNSSTLQELNKVWEDAEMLDLLPSRYLWLTVRMLFNRVTPKASNRMYDFLVSHGFKPEYRFRDMKIPLFLTATDLNSYTQVIYGLDPQDSLLEAVLASTALPPWINPIEREDKLLLDGGVVSNLPIQTALEAGATEIIALDLSDHRTIIANTKGFGPFLGKLIFTVQSRQMELELALAKAQQVPVHIIRLQGKNAVQIWDFTQTRALIEDGYTLARNAIAEWQAVQQPVKMKSLSTKPHWLQMLVKRFLRK